jgi:hypothetical protein
MKPHPRDDASSLLFFWDTAFVLFSVCHWGYVRMHDARLYDFFPFL